MYKKHIKKPSILGKGYLGQQTLGQRFAYKKHTPKGFAKQYKTIEDLPMPIDFYQAEIANFTEYGDSWAWGCCPFHWDRNPSFAMNIDTGGFCCMSTNCGIKGANIVSFVSQLHGLDLHDSINFLENWHE